MGTTDITHVGVQGFFTVAEDNAYYAASGAVNATTATILVRAEATDVLVSAGEPGAVFEVVSPSGVALVYAAGGGTLEAGRTETTAQGIAAAAGVPPGMIEIRGRTQSGAACRAFFGGFESLSSNDGGAPTLRVPIVAGMETRLPVRCH
jgi:hypothetical protein